MNNSKSKNDIFYFILLILTMIVMIIGVTFTFMSLLAKEKDDSTIIQTGILSINYVDGPAIDTYSLIPISEPSLDTKYSVFKKCFSVSSDGTLDQTFDMYITVDKNEFQENSLMYALYNQNNKKISKGYIPTTGKILILSNENLKSKQSKNYTLLIWLQENNQNQNGEQLKNFSGGIDINAVQIKYK